MLLVAAARKYWTAACAVTKTAAWTISAVFFNWGGGGGGGGGEEARKRRVMVQTSLSQRHGPIKWQQNSKVCLRKGWNNPGWLHILASAPSLPLPQQHAKDPTPPPCHSAQSACCRWHLNVHTSLAQASRSEPTTLSRHRAGTHQGNDLTHNLPGNAHPVVSACWATADWSSALQSYIGMRQLITTSLKKKKKCNYAGREWFVDDNLPYNHCMQRKKAPAPNFMLGSKQP